MSLPYTSIALPAWDSSLSLMQKPYSYRIHPLNVLIQRSFKSRPFWLHAGALCAVKPLVYWTIWFELATVLQDLTQALSLGPSAHKAYAAALRYGLYPQLWLMCTRKSLDGPPLPRFTLPSGVSFHMTEKVSLSVMGLRLHSSSQSSLGSIGITCEIEGSRVKIHLLALKRAPESQEHQK